jgi:hypothetical protein
MILSVVMLSVSTLSVNLSSALILCVDMARHYAESHYAECQSEQCRGPIYYSIHKSPIPGNCHIG